jgi:hypothetical protein
MSLFPDDDFQFADSRLNGLMLDVDAMACRSVANIRHQQIVESPAIDRNSGKRTIIAHQPYNYQRGIITHYNAIDRSLTFAMLIALRGPPSGYYTFPETTVLPITQRGIVTHYNAIDRSITFENLARIITVL